MSIKAQDFSYVTSFFRRRAAGRFSAFIPLQRRRTQLCALGLDCPYYADPDQP